MGERELLISISLDTFFFLLRDIKFLSYTNVGKRERLFAIKESEGFHKQ